MLNLPDWIFEVCDKYLTCEFTHIRKDGTPIVYPLMQFGFDEAKEKLIYTTGIGTPGKILAIRSNPKVSVLLSNPIGSGLDYSAQVLVQGTAELDDSDLDRGWEKYNPIWERKQPSMRLMMEKRHLYEMMFYFKRVIIKVTPKVVYGWKSGDLNSKPEVYRF